MKSLINPLPPNLMFQRFFFQQGQTTQVVGDASSISPLTRVPRLLTKLSLAFALGLLMIGVTQAQFYNGDPGSDAFASAPSIWASITNTNPTDLAAFTREGREPEHRSPTYPAVGKTAWWKWQCLKTGWCAVHTTQTGGVTNGLGDTVLAVYTGTSVTNLQRVTSNDDLSYNGQNHGHQHSWARFLAEAGTIYYIAVDAGSSTALTAGSRVVLSLRQYVPTNATLGGTVLLASPNINGANNLPCLITATTTSAGRLTGKMTTPIKAWSFSGAFSVDGFFEVNLEMPTIKGQPQEPPINLRIDGLGIAYLSHKLGITNLGGLSTRQRYTNDAPGQGLFNVELITGSDFGGYGYAQVKVKPNGSVSIVTTLPDGTTTTMGSWLHDSSTQKSIPALSILYKKKGALLSQLTHYVGNLQGIVTINGSCFIQRPAAFSGSFYEDGFSASVYAYGRIYTLAQAGSMPLDFIGPNGGAGKLTLISDGEEFPGLVNQQEDFTVDTKGKFIFASAVNKPILKLNVKTGLVSGSLTDTGGVKRKLKGVLLGDEDGTARILGQASGARHTLRWIATEP